MITAPHLTTVDMAFQALQDTMSGTESLKLTYAQRYMEGVLQSEGTLKKLEGNEGIISAVGNGLQKIWEYIKKMFAWIFGAGGGNDAADKTLEKQEKRLSLQEEFIDKIVSGNIDTFTIKTNGQRPEKIAKYLGSHAYKVADGFIKLDDDQLKEILEKLPDNPTDSQIDIEVVKAIIKKGENNKAQKDKVKEMVGKLRKQHEEYVKTVGADHSQLFKGTNIEKFYKEVVKDWFGGIVPILVYDELEKVNTLNDLKGIIPALGHEVKSIKNDLKTLIKDSAEFKKNIEQAETILKGNISDKDRADLNKDLPAVKELARIFVVVLEATKAWSVEVYKVQTELFDIFGLSWPN